MLRRSAESTGPELPERVALWGQGRSMVRHRLKEVSLPTLIIWGDSDPLIPLAHGQLAARLIPNHTVLDFLAELAELTPGQD